MAFDVTPTSGTAPYTFTADFLNKESFDFGYVLEFWRNESTFQTCAPPEAATTAVPSAAESLLKDDVYQRQVPVTEDRCQTFRLDIRDSLGNVIDTQSVTISNVVAP